MCSAQHSLPYIKVGLIIKQFSKQVRTFEYQFYNKTT